MHSCVHQGNLGIQGLPAICLHSPIALAKLREHYRKKQKLSYDNVLSKVVLGSISLSDIGWGSAQGQRLIRPIHAFLAGGSLGLIYRTPQEKYPDTSVTLLWWQRCDSGTYDVVPLHGRTIKPMGLPLTPPLTPY